MDHHDELKQALCWAIERMAGLDGVVYRVHLNDFLDELEVIVRDGTRQYTLAHHDTLYKRAKDVLDALDVEGIARQHRRLVVALDDFHRWIIDRVTTGEDIPMVRCRCGKYLRAPTHGEALAKAARLGWIVPEHWLPEPFEPIPGICAECRRGRR